METGKSVARLRLVRELLGRTGSEDEGEEREAGFTLIELMVVLLIMGILLAIAIPTFLSVTGGAKKTAAQSNLTNAMTSTTGYYSQNNNFATKTGAANSTAMAKALHNTQTSITFTTGNPKKGANSVSVYEPTLTVVVLSAWDGAGDCWVAAQNQGATADATLKTLPRGDHFGAITAAVKTGATCKASAVVGNAAFSGWSTNFKTVKKPTT